MVTNSRNMRPAWLGKGPRFFASHPSHDTWAQPPVHAKTCKKIRESGHHTLTSCSNNSSEYFRGLTVERLVVNTLKGTAATSRVGEGIPVLVV